MNYSNEALREQGRERLSALVAAGPGVHAYALDEAEKMVKAHPMYYAGLVAEVERQIGVDETAKARKVLKWFEKNP